MPGADSTQTEPSAGADPEPRRANSAAAYEPAGTAAIVIVIAIAIVVIVIANRALKPLGPIPCTGTVTLLSYQHLRTPLAATFALLTAAELRPVASHGSELDPAC